jgi:secondary thiamine-phosphate synthase enzyme
MDAVAHGVLGMSEMWFQDSIQLPPFPRGFHLVTRQIIAAIPQLTEAELGLLHVHILHTSASLTINENADSDVRVDLENLLNEMVSEDFTYTHTCEGPDDMPAHVKSSLLGNSVSVPVRNGQLLLGTWQGIYLCEHRDHAQGRRLVITLQGQCG